MSTSITLFVSQQKAKVDQQHRVKILVSKLVSVNDELLKLYEDKGTLNLYLKNIICTWFLISYFVFTLA